ncbi:MAG: membrane protein insertase YidC [Gemmatimonadaceae bacterium]
MDKRFFLALFLSLIIIAISQLLFPPTKPVPAPRGTKAIDTNRVQASMTPSQRTQTIQRTDSTTQQSRGSIVQKFESTAAETTTVITPKAIYRFSNLGATLVSIVIRDYPNRSSAGGLVELGVPRSPLLRYQVVGPGDTVDFSRIPFALSRAKNTKGEEVLSYSSFTSGFKANFTYTISADTSASYIVHVGGRITGPQGKTFLLTDLPRTLPSAEADTIADHRSLAYSFKPQRDHAGSVLFGSLDPGETRLQPGPLNWVAVKNKYFVLGLLAPTNSTPFSEVSLTGGARTSKIATSASATVVQALDNGSFSFDIYAGPQESQRLLRMGRDFDHVNPYGWRFLQSVVHPIASKVIQGLLWMHHRLNLSYGWVLIILGVLIRLALWPLNQSTMRSSLRMQELQPKLAAAQKKYKDPVQQREAIMKVYHDAGVSPFAGLTGCLPALLPMPILFALFFVFQNTIEFRGVPFLWLHDISIKDPFYILPLLMGASMYLLSWIGMRNAPPNPQAKMMGYMFPVMMTVVLLNMASGLNLYYTAQNIAALPQQWMLARERAKVRPAG